MAGEIPGNESTTVLVVDDEPSNRASLERIFLKEDMRVLTAGSGREALDLCRKHRINVVLTDLMMPGMSGIDLIKAMQTVAPNAEVVVMTAYGTIETAVESMREGAYDFVEKPLKRMQIVKTVKKAAERHALVAENRTLKQELSALKNRAIVGSSRALRHSLDVARTAAPSSANVLVLGESGTGKELLARTIHEHSQRDGSFVGVNLAALPETIVESELFGHEKGSFTGATHRREGRITQAEGGTLFLDEIGELSPTVQVKLLRVLQEGEYEPIGGKTQRANFRLIAATNVNLEQAVETGRFREDLYYRLNVIAITSPRLADRRDDIPLLTDHFLELYCRKNGKARMSVAHEALEVMMGYAWPGNVRELENVIERAVVLSKGDTLEIADLPTQISQSERRGGDLTFSIGTPLEDIERRVIKATLDHTRGDKQLAAQLLGISARTIYRKVG
ncbi:MAG: sigma-54-dependent transcriptional regulator [Sandaracinaceae bacterium]